MESKPITKKQNGELTIVIVSNAATPQGGASKVAIDSALALSQCGLKVVFFSGTGPICEELQQPSIENICLDRKPYLEEGGATSALRGLWDRQVAAEFRKLLSRLNPNETLVHFHSWQHSISASPIGVAAKMGFPVVITAHEYSLVCPNMALFDYRAKENCEIQPMSFKCFKCNCDKRSRIHKLYRFIRERILVNTLSKSRFNVIYISKRSRKIIESKISAKLYITRSFYLPDPINRTTTCPHLEYDERDDYVVFVGRLSPEKDPKTFCEAVRMAQVRGIVVGDGDLRDELESAYPDVEFVGWKSHEEVLDYIAHSKGLVFPSICFETAGLSVLEANMTSETPCIIASNSVTAEYATDGSGLLFEAGDHADLAQKIEELMAPEVFQDLQEIIHNKNFSEFDATTYADTLIAIYEEIATERKGLA